MNAQYVLDIIAAVDRSEEEDWEETTREERGWMDEARGLAQEVIRLQEQVALLEVAVGEGR